MKPITELFLKNGRFSSPAHGVGGVLLLLSVAGASAATFNPIATTGHDQDIVFEAGLSDGQVGANGEIGSRQFFEAGVFADGVPRSVTGVTTLGGNTLNYDFQPFEENNILKFVLGTEAKALTLVTPSAYGSLAVVFSGGSLGTTTEYAILDYIINYAGGVTQPGTLNAPDWGAVPTLPSGTERLLIADRTTANATTWPISSDNNTMANRWAIYFSEVPVTRPDLDIESITFGPAQLFTIASETTGPLVSGDDVVVFGISGSAVPEPSSLALVGFGALLLGWRVRRRTV